MSHDYNNRYVGPAFDLLMEGLRPFVEQQFQAYCGNNWRAEIALALRQDAESPSSMSTSGMHLDAHGLLTLLRGTGWQGMIVI
jgi:hypothetical protein